MGKLFRLSVFQLVAILLSISCESKAQLLKPVKFYISVDKKEVKVGDTLTLNITGEIIKDFYMYSSQFEAEGPLKTVLELETFKGLKKADSLTCKNCKTKYDDIWEGNISYATHEIVFVQKYVVTATDYLLKGKVSGQACKTDGVCVQVSGDFNFTGSAVAGTGAEKKSPDENKVQEKSAQEVGFSPCGDDQSLWSFLFLAISGGFLALLTPCVFPMLPMTVTFFLKRNKTRGRAIFEALLYTFFIIFIYTFIGFVLTLLLGRDTGNTLSTHWIPNLIFFITFIVFGLSFLGLFEITLPHSWANKTDEKSEKGGLLGIFFMALTLVVVSFSCTGPIASSLLAGASSGCFWKPTLGMMAYSAAFALPFGLFAIFPSMLSALPKSGGWLNTVKVTLGLLELALAFKFISQADLAYHWSILPRNVFLAIHIVVFAVIGLYLLKIVTIGYEENSKKVGAIQALFGMLALVVALYMVPGLFGAPLRAFSGYLPPSHYQEFILNKNEESNADNKNASCFDKKYADLLFGIEGVNGYFDYTQALQCAKDQGKPLFIDFTGHACANCRRMEDNVFSKADIKKLFNEKYVVVTLYVDDKTQVSEKEWVTSKSDGKVKKTIGDINTDLQVQKFNMNAQPYYVILDPQNESLYKTIAYSGYEEFKAFLEKGLK